MRYLPGSGALTDWKELDNKLEAFRLFQYPEREVGDPLREGAIAMALRLPDFRAIWVLEGIAHERAVHEKTATIAILPDRTGVSTHAGLGTALAERTLEGLSKGADPGKDPSPEAFRLAILDFAAEACARSRPGWEPAALEPFGLVVRGLYPQWLRMASEAMPSHEMRSLFWHGAGRSAYFAPASFIPLPGAHGRLLRSALEDAPNGPASNGPASSDDARLNLIAGLIWAAVLVNLPRPAVAASFARACADLNLADAFRNGLQSALLAWRHMAPLDAKLLQPYISPNAPAGIPRTLWKTMVIEPAVVALEEIYPKIERAGRIAHLFRYRTVTEMQNLD